MGTTTRCRGGVHASPGLRTDAVQAPDVLNKNPNKTSATYSTTSRVFSVDKAMAFVLSHQDLGRALREVGELFQAEMEPTASVQSFDDVGHIGISEGKAEALWRLEIERLVVGVNDRNVDMFFPETAVPFPDYKLLARLAREVQTLCLICSIDNQILLAENEQNFYDREALHVLVHKMMHYQAPPGSQDPRSSGSKAKQTGSHRTVLTEKERQGFIFCLVDFITLTLVRLLIDSNREEVWAYSCMASLAKVATKFKVLSSSSNLRHFTLASMDAARRYLEPSGEKSSSRPPDDFIDYRQSDSSFYRRNHYVRYAIDSWLPDVLNNLGGEPGAGLTIQAQRSFEICSVVYETGLERFRTWVYQQPDGMLQGTACRDTIPLAQSGFRILQRIANELVARRKQRPPRSTGVPSTAHSQVEQFRTCLRWRDLASDDVETAALDQNSSDRHFEICTMSEAISVMVPFLLVSPRILKAIPHVIYAVDTWSLKTRLGFYSNVQEKKTFSEDHIPKEAGKFKAFFCMYTESHDEIKRRLNHVDSGSLFQGLNVRDRLQGNRSTEIYRQSSLGIGNPASLLVQPADANIELQARANREMNKWVYEEKVVLVNCRVYVLTVMSAATLLAVCGAIAGFTVGDRVKAVDPFNMTTYCWVLAAFVVLVAKSVRVETWPWRDFLRGRVRCRSVSELCSVTGINEQLILCKLLDNEHTSILKTRGPYNAAFQNQSEEGFSIDKPLYMWTMLLSGLIMVKVSTGRGPGLVCLDIRRGTTYATVASVGSDEERLVCDVSALTDLKAPEFSLKRAKTSWRGVVGLYYNHQDAKFV